MRVVSVVGARPQFVKLSPVARAMGHAAGIDHRIVHTGQHYDDLLSDVFFRDLGIPSPDVNLGVGSGPHGAQTGAMLSGLEEVFLESKPDLVVVYGDTNSTLAATLAAVKLEVPVAHLEAGLRSFNRRMPEEHNRVLTDHAADLLLAPTEVAMGHLAREGLAERAVNVGDVMTDVCYEVRDRVRDEPITLPKGVDPLQPYLLATVHRPENTDDSKRLARIVDGLADLPSPVVLLAHPRLVARSGATAPGLTRGSIVATEPLAYPHLVRAVLGAAGVVTDSGGLQKEAYLLQTPCTTLRGETEWVETLADGWNVLDGDLALDPATVLRARPASAQSSPFGDGHAAKRAVEAILAFGAST